MNNFNPSACKKKERQGSRWDRVAWRRPLSSPFTEYHVQFPIHAWEFGYLHRL